MYKIWMLTNLPLIKMSMYNISLDCFLDCSVSPWLADPTTSVSQALLQYTY